MVDWIPVLSQIKSLVQVVFHDSEGARQTQINFSTRCPVVSQVRSLVEVVVDSREAAEKTQWEFLKNCGKIANNVPVIGHAKGGVHYICGDIESGNDAMKAATRAAGAVVGGGLGLVAGGPLGVATMGPAAATIVDGIFTGAESHYYKELRPNGVLKGICDIVDDPKNPGLWVDTALLIGTDALTEFIVPREVIPEEEDIVIPEDEE